MKNCTVLLKRLDPALLTQNSTKKIRKSLEEMRDYNIRKNQRYRDEMNSRFNLLRKWVPGTSTLSRLEILKRTVKYIQELEHKIKELETSQNVMEIPVSSEEEKLLRSPDEEEEFLVSPEEEMELLASGDEEELPEFNCIDDLRQWLEL